MYDVVVINYPYLDRCVVGTNLDNNEEFKDRFYDLWAKFLTKFGTTHQDLELVLPMQWNTLWHESYITHVIGFNPTFNYQNNLEFIKIMKRVPLVIDSDSYSTVSIPIVGSGHKLPTVEKSLFFGK